MELEQFKISAVINVDGLNKKGDWENYNKRNMQRIFFCLLSHVLIRPPGMCLPSTCCVGILSFIEGFPINVLSSLTGTRLLSGVFYLALFTKVEEKHCIRLEFLWVYIFFSFPI